MWHDFRFLLLLDNFQYNFRYLVVIINNFYRSIDKSHNFVQKYICKSRVSTSFITSILSPFSMSSWEILINSNSSSEWVIKTINTSIYVNFLCHYFMMRIMSAQFISFTIHVSFIHLFSFLLFTKVFFEDFCEKVLTLVVQGGTIWPHFFLKAVSP